MVVRLQRERLGIGLILGVYLVVALAYSVLLPPLESSDEVFHYPLVHHLAENGLRLPIMDPDNIAQWRQEGGQPPLYYFITALAIMPLDTSDYPAVYDLNRHADTGFIPADGNTHMIMHPPGQLAFPWRGTILAILVARWLSVLMGAVTVLTTYLIGREVFPDWPEAALGAAALNAFLPMFLFISASVNNDNLSNMLAGLLLWQIIRLLKAQEAPAYRVYGAVGITAGAGLLAKLSLGYLLPVVALALLLLSLRLRDWRPVVWGGVISGGLTILIAGWWYWRNATLYGDPTGLNTFLAVVGERAVPADWAQLWSERESFWRSWWGLFGGVNVPLPDWTYSLLNTFAVVGVIGFVAYVIFLLLCCILPPGSRSADDAFGELSGYRFVAPERPSGVQNPQARVKNWKSLKGLFRSASNTFRGFQAFRIATGLVPVAEGLKHSHKPSLILLIIWPLLVFFALMKWSSITWASQGRLLFVAIGPISVWLTVGWTWFLGKQTGRAVLVVVSAVFLLTAILTPFLVIRPVYALPDLSGPDLTTALPADLPCTAANFHEPGAEQPTLRLRGYDIHAEAAQPGDALTVTLYWEVLQTPTRRWSLFIHVLDGVDLIAAQRDRYPGQGLLATERLAAGDQWSEAMVVSLPDFIYTPDTLTLKLGLYDFATGERMWLAGDAALELFTLDPPVVLNAADPDAALPNSRADNFSDLITLAGYAISDRRVRPGEELTVTLYWQAQQPIPDEYTVFVQVLDPETWAVHGGSDAQPAGWTRPTSSWGVGEIIEDSHTFTISTEAPPGVYPVEIGLYLSPEAGVFERLPVLAGVGGQTGNAVRLGAIAIDPAGE